MQLFTCEDKYWNVCQVMGYTMGYSIVFLDILLLKVKSNLLNIFISPADKPFLSLPCDQVVCVSMW